MNKPRLIQSTPWAGPAVQKPWLKQNQYNPPPYVVNNPYMGNNSWKGGPPRQRRPPPTVPASFLIDENARYTGVVKFYNKWKGFGFIQMSQSGIVPNDELFVHWRHIESDDRFPFLVKDREVEFGLMKEREKYSGGLSLRAKLVTQIGGMNIAVQDEVDAQFKTFVGGQHLRYTGTCKFFNPRGGYGYVTLDQGYDLDPSVPSDLRVETTEVSSGGQRVMRMENLAVEFGIWKNKRGTYLVYNMTLPGGHPLTQDALENRISIGPQTYKGEVAIWNWRGGWGFVQAESPAMLPPRVVAKLAQQQQAAIARGRQITNEKMLYFRRPDCHDGFNISRGAKVTFQVYIDDKGAGASDVRAA